MDVPSTPNISIVVTAHLHSVAVRGTNVVPRQQVCLVLIVYAVCAVGMGEFPGLKRLFRLFWPGF
jgi:hypothetical protein